MRHEVPVPGAIAISRGSPRSILVSAGVAILLCGCGQPGWDSRLDPAAASLQAPSGQPVGGDDPGPPLQVVGGDSVPVCSFPMSAKIPGCTASLLTSTILLTAKHCGPKAGMTIQFGEKAPFAFSVKAVKCVTAKDSDAAYCVLPDDERLKQVPVVPPLHGCEYTKFMKVGARLTGVGFGQTMGTGPARAKNEVEVPVARVRDPFIDVGDKTHDLCFGDSGGGAYIHLVEGDKDWGWRVIGTVTGTARGVGAPCGGTDYTTVLRHIKLIEDTEKIDITPCTDAAGAWAPGPECTSFLTDIKTGGGAWPACNYGPRTTMPIDSCGNGPGPASPVDGGAAGGAGGSAGLDAGKLDTGAAGTGGAGGTSATGGSGGGGGPGDGVGGTAGAGGAAPPGGPAPRADAATSPPSDPGAKAKPAGTVTGGCQLGAGGTGGPGASLLVLFGLCLLNRRRRR
jgi:hypothetical protein